MTDQSVPEVFNRVLTLLTHAPEQPDFSHGYLDLLGDQPGEPSGPIQSFWESDLGSNLYDHAQSLARRMFPTWYRLPSPTRPPAGGRVLDIGCGPGNVTAKLGRAIGPAGLAIGVDVSRPMLARAAQTQTAGNVGFVRADARELPFPDGTFDLVTSFAALQLIPEPHKVLAEMTGKLAPGAWLAVMVPTPRDGLLHRTLQLFGDRSGLTFFDPTELAESLHAVGMETVHTHQTGPVLWISARRPE
ncbi:methyltransferase domain-containing protein [Saccharopolyspora sp. K220]|uniref:class I SAM-dependent methyltransferase n=1 Tax=Saccharopolyspora soli TaxID=2926618 RepID=UPI001F56B87E|nr:methyltransferase domain-containing protein [Saccharopolyspora soli]MCI2423131.1 methyltransferase domain-containing protein [Saccharopolyspora soli]